MKAIAGGALGALLFLSGCAGSTQDSGSVYANFRAVEDMQLVQTFGYDWHDGEVTVTVSSGEETEKLPTTLLSASAPDIPQAIELLQDWSAREDLFFAHIRYVLVGEEAAQHGLEELLDWFERGTQTRLDLPVFVVEGGSAREAITGSEDPLFEITAALMSLERDVERRGKSYPFTLRELAARMSRSGSALCTSVRLAETAEHIPSSPEGLTVLETGFAVFRDWQLHCFSGAEAARGLCLLLNKAGSGNVLVSDGADGFVTLELGTGRAEFTPRWDAAGRPSLAVTLRRSASVVSADTGDSLRDEELLRVLNAAFSAWLEERCRAALALSGACGADILDLGRLFEAADPVLFANCDWPAALKTMEVSVDARGTVERSYDILFPENAPEGTDHA